LLQTTIVIIHQWMDLRVAPYHLQLTRRWAIASRTGPGGGPGTLEFPVVLVSLRDGDGCEGLGESAPSSRYGETPQSVRDFLQRVDAERLSFADLPGSLAYLDSLDPGQPAAKTALEIALVDGAAKRAGVPVHTWLGLGFTEGRHVTSFSIGLDTPEVVRIKVEEAAEYPVLKLKLGGLTDRENLAALREVAPDKLVRVDANEAWKTREQALQHLEWLATDGRVQFVEQPLPASTPRQDLEWLKERSPIPLMADESFCCLDDLPGVIGCFHAVNVKLVKTGGITPGLAALRAAREAGLQTMLGCMIESSVLIAAAAHLADLTDYLDLDGNLLISNDPFEGPTARAGLLSMAHQPPRTGLGVVRRPGAPI
jgi:L-alanine-DL-glutamate epimerase-like enolase superfamily enzyme